MQSINKIINKVQTRLPSDFETLPPEILRIFLLKVPINDLKQLCRTSSQVQAFCEDDGFWKQLVQRDFSVTQLINTDSYKCLYQLLSTRIFMITVDLNMHVEQAYSMCFLTFEAAINELLDRIQFDDLFNIGKFPIQQAIQILSSEGIQISQDFINYILNSDLSETEKIALLVERSNFAQQYSDLKRILNKLIYDTAVDEVFNSDNNTFELRTNSQPNDVYSIRIEKFNLKDELDLEPKYDFIQINGFSLDNDGQPQIFGAHVINITFTQYLKNLIKYNKEITIDPVEKTFSHFDWYQRTVRVSDQVAHDRFIELIKIRVPHLIKFTS